MIDQLAELLARTAGNGWIFAAGICFLVGGAVGLVYILFTWGGVAMGPDPVIPPAVDPEPTRPTLPPKTHLRVDSDTGVIPRIPGAAPPEAAHEPHTAPKCPICGGPWHTVCPSKVVQPPVLVPLDRNEPKKRRKALDPLTSQEIRVAAEAETPFHDAIVRNTSTRDLSGDVARILAATSEEQLT